MTSLRSKRFQAFVISIVLFVIMVYTTDYGPTEIAGALTLISGVYIGAQSIRGSVSDGYQSYVRPKNNTGTTLWQPNMTGYNQSTSDDKKNDSNIDI